MGRNSYQAQFLIKDLQNQVDTRTRILGSILVSGVTNSATAPSQSHLVARAIALHHNDVEDNRTDPLERGCRQRDFS